MRTVNYILIALFGFFTTQTLCAQADTIRIEGKNQKRVIILDKGEETKVILKDSLSSVVIKMENERNKDSSASISYEFGQGKVNIENNGKRKNYSFNFLSDFSFGYANPGNNTGFTLAVIDPYALPKLNSGLNFSMNFLKQEISLVKHQLFLTAAFGINNYYYGVNDKREIPLKESTTGKFIYQTDSFNNYEKNRVDSRFYSVPIMLKWNPSKDGSVGKFSLAAGVELNFNNRVYSKLKIDTDEKQLKSKTDLNIGFDNVVPSYILRMQYGPIGVFGRYVPGGVINTIRQRGDVFSFGLASKF